MSSESAPAGRPSRWALRAAIAALLVSTGVACNRNKQDAILMANEGDKALKGDLDSAITKFKEATEIDPANHAIWNKLAQARWKKADWAGAAAAFAGAIKAEGESRKDRKPTFASYFEGRGYALEQRATIKKEIDIKEAEEPYQECIKLDPNYASCYFGLGNVYLRMDDEQKALDYYTRAIEHDPTQVMYYGPLAQLYLSLGYTKEGEEVLKASQKYSKAEEPDPKNRQYISTNCVLLANILLERGDLKGAAEQLERSKAMAPGDSPEAVRVLYGLGNIYADLDPPQKQNAIDNLKAFQQRVCSSGKRDEYKVECATIGARLVELDAPS
ncbi:MAG: tetratricopeptide repeat protein [Polyangiaceae bacterium]